MLQQTKGIVLRSIKYGETSLITTIFTRDFGVQSYIIKGVRSQISKQHKASLLQPASLIDLVGFQKQHQNIQHLREYQAAHIYHHIQEEIVLNSVALFSIEFLLRILPEHAPQQEIFDFCLAYFISLDLTDKNNVANFPLYFIGSCSKMLGYEIKGDYDKTTPYLNIVEGGYAAHPPISEPTLNTDAAIAFAHLLKCNSLENLQQIEMSSTTRHQLLEWYLDFLHYYCQHLGAIKSLRVLQTILH